jgi:hypothetical protein
MTRSNCADCRGSALGGRGSAVGAPNKVTRTNNHIAVFLKGMASI